MSLVDISDDYPYLEQLLLGVPDVLLILWRRVHVEVVPGAGEDLAAGNHLATCGRAAAKRKVWNKYSAKIPLISFIRSSIHGRYQLGLN